MCLALGRRAGMTRWGRWVGPERERGDAGPAWMHDAAGTGAIGRAVGRGGSEGIFAALSPCNQWAGNTRLGWRETGTGPGDAGRGRLRAQRTQAAGGGT